MRGATSEVEPLRSFLINVVVDRYLSAGSLGSLAYRSPKRLDSLITALGLVDLACTANGLPEDEVLQEVLAFSTVFEAAA